ncbi:MAG: NUDIX domain-containing protein [Streptosporangiaceae bacterium]|jgi:8-oxo-dGTP diphosphatase
MTDVIVAAGAVVWRPTPGPPHGDGGSAGGRGVEVLLVHRPKYDDWSLPKGKCEPGEHVALTAVREVFEETSVRSPLGPRLPSVQYQNGAYRKDIDYWSMRSLGTQAAASHEVDSVSWLPLAQARERLSYARDVAVVDGLVPRETVPLILLRHASAGARGEWPADDESRPLDAKGVTDAHALAGLLSCFAPKAQVLSSPALRCTESVRPYAASFEGEVEAADALALPGHSSLVFSRTNRGDALADLVRQLVADGRPAVLCLHRENLPKALAAARTALGAPPSPGPSALPKAGFFILHMAPGELVALERYVLLARSFCWPRLALVGRFQGAVGALGLVGGGLTGVASLVLFVGFFGCGGLVAVAAAAHPPDDVGGEQDHRRDQ